MPDYTTSFQSYFNTDAVRLSGPKVLTVKSVGQEEMGREDGPKETKVVIRFVEDPRGVVANKTRYDALADIFGSPDTDKWIGGKVELFADMSVRRPGGGRGAIGVRATAAR